MNTIADYTEWKLRKQQAGANAANIVLQSSQGSPDEIAGDLNLANEFGKVTGNPVPPLPMVQEYRSVFQHKIEEARNKTILSNAPRLADWLRNPENAALSRDDLERLAWFERFGLYPKDAAGVSFGQGLANTLSYAGEQLTQMYNQFMMEQTQGRARDRELTFADILKEESQTDLVGPDGQRLETWDGSNFLRAAARWIDAQYAELIGADDKAASEEYAKRLGETLNTMRAIPKSDIASQFETDAMKEGASFGEAVVNFATAFARNPMGGMAWAIETAGRSAPQLAAALATTVLTRNPMAGAGVAAGGSYLTERYVSPAEFFDEHGIDLSKQEDVQRLLNDPKLMEDAAKRGVIRGLVIGAFDALSMGVAGKTLAKNPLVEALAQGATQMVLGASGEYAARVAAGQEIDWNDVLAEGLAEIATTPIDLGIAGRRVQIMRRQAREAEEQRTAAEAMSNAAKVSALRNRMPERFRDFVARATEGGAVENVYVPAEQFVQYFQDLGADPWALVDDLDGVTRDDLDAALAAGGDLRIPTATYAAKIAGSDHDAWFLDNLKFDPEQMSTAEAAEFNARVQDIMEEAWEEAEAIRREMEAHRTYEEEIYDTIVSRLRAAGQATDVSTTQAQLYARMYLAMADRAKMTVEEFMRRYPLPEIRGALPEGAKFMDVDELTRILAAARARRSPLTVKRGMSLLEFIAERGGIRDVGGDVRSILGGQTEIKRGRGKKTLKIVRDDSYDDTGSLFGGGPKVDEKGRAHGLDDVAQAAIEAGYLADHPDVVAWKAAIERGDQVPDIRNALLEAIDEELRGRPSYSIDDQVDQRAIEEDEFYDQFDEYLDRLGVSLDDPDDVIREAVRKDEEARRAEMEDARMYGQDGRINTDSEAFKRWFGDSKVVDENGEPLVVYHGTGADFEAFSEAFADDVGLAGKGFYFTNSRDEALGYAERNETPNVIAAYVSIMNPLVIRAGKLPDGRSVMDIHRKYSPVSNRHGAAEIRSIAEQNNNDGVIWLGNDGSIRHAVAFSPEQIKSVNNRGTWDPNDSRILYQTAYHGSPHFFDRFSLDKIGTGEGAQAFGWGLYFASKKEVAEHYRNVLSRRDDPGAGGRLYEVDIPEEDELLIWDKPLSEQPEKVKDALRSVIESIAEPEGITYQELVDTGQTFGEIYMGLQDIDGVSDRQISEALRAAGIPGHKYLDGGSRGDGEGSYNYVIYDDSRINIMRYEQNRGGGARGAISYRFDGERLQRLIQLFEKADLSTFLHEAGHDFLIILRDLANLEVMQGYADRPIGEMYDVVRNWWLENAKDIVVEAKKARGIDVSEADVQAFINNGTTGDTVKDEAIDVGVNEYWARGFEAYLMEGKAPSEALRGAFEKFRAWLLSVYEKIIQIVGRDPSRVMGVNLNDDIRGVFDRMLATDEEIAKAQQKTGGISPVFTTAEQLGMTDEEYQRFLKLREKAEDEAKAKVLAEIMAPVKRQTERWYKEERAKVREQVEREVNSWRVYRAIEWMGNRRWLGDGQPEGMPDVRLSKDILVKRYGEGVLKTLPRGQQTVYTVDGGVDPDDVAGWFGFSSGDEMIQAMESAPRRVEAIEAETDKRMRELHGDPLNDGSIEVMALDAVHTEKRGEWIAAELKAVNEVAGLDLALTYKQAREMARQTVARMRVRDAMASNRYLAAERKAADEAERLAKMLGRNSAWMNAARRRIQSKAKAALREEASPDAVARQIDQANRSTENYNEIAERFVQAKRRQLINHALYMESRRVAEEVEKAENFVRKLNKASHREKIAGAGRRENAQIDYLAAIDEILERYDFRRMSARQEERRASLVEFVEAMKAAGRESELAIPDKVLRDSQRRPYKTLTVEELRGVVDSLKNLEHIALRWNKLIDEKRQRDFDEAKGTIISTILENKPTKDKQWVKDTGVKISLLDGAKEYLASLQTATTILRGLDGDKDIGPVYEILKTPLDEAAYAEREMLADAAKKLEELYSLYSVDEQREMAVKRHYPELGGSFSKWNLIMMGLNMGNEGNLARLTNQRARKHLTEAQVEIVKNLLDERDARFIQGVWDLIGSYRDAIAKRERRQKGVEPNWVEAKPVTIGGVELRGGYFPIKYARDLGGGSEIAADMSYDDILASMMGGRFSGTHTKDGHLKERAANTDMSLLLDTSVIGRHLVEVIHDLTHGEAIVNATRLLADREVRQAFIDTGLESQYEQLRLWVQDAAVGQVSQSDFYSKAIQKLRSGFTFSKLAINLKTILLQPLGLSQSAVVVGKARLMRNVMKFWGDPRAMRDQVVAKSRIMWEREKTFNKDIMDMVADANVSSPSASKIRDFRDQYIVPLGMAGITFTQFYTVDMPVWMAAYEKGLEMFGGDDARAVHYADMTVERTQGSGLFINRAGIERGTTSQKRRQDPFVLLLTTLGSYFFAKLNVAITRTRELRAQQITPVEAVNYALDMLLLFSFEAVVMTLAGELFGGGDDDDDSIAAEIVKETAKTVAGGLPVVRDLAGMIEGFDGGTYGAILKIFADTFRNTAKDVSNAEIRKTTVKNAVNLVGMLGRLPSTQINRVIDAAWREAEGEDVAPVEYLFGRQKR